MVGQTISHYKITEKLGEGGMGVVYKAEDTNLDRTVALKFLAPHLLMNQDAKRRFVREAKAAAALDHPNICTLYEIDEAEGRTFMAMAYLDGQTLEKRIAEGPLALDQAVEIAKQIAKGLQEAHSKGISHRDIKPSNVSLLQTSSKELLVKIMDFGLAYLAGQTQLTQQDSTVGTIAYMSPEQAQAAGVDHRTDIWALGVVLYEMVSGQRPFRGEYDQAVTYSVVNEEPEPLTSLRTGVPMELEWIVGKMLAKDRERRYQSCVELIVDLEGLKTKQRIESSRAAPAMPGLSSLTRPSETAGQREGRAGEPAADVVVSGEQAQPLRKRRVRELILDLGNKGLLPDRILSQALEAISRSPDEDSELEAERNRLLDELLYERIRVGEFIEQWQELEVEIGESEGKKKSKKKRKWRDSRSRAEVFGIPLSHKAWGKDPSTGKQRIAMGVFAFGNISVGFVAFARWMGIGVVAISPISIGVWALGLIAIGFDAAGPFGLALKDLPFWQALIVVFAAALVGGFLFNRHKARRPPEERDLLDELALFSRREWRDAGALRGGRVIAICGRYLVDLTEVEGPEQEIALDATALLGAVSIRVPEDWRVKIDGQPILGRFHDQRERSPERDQPGPRLVLRGTAALGSVKVVSS